MKPHLAGHNASVGSSVIDEGECGVQITTWKGERSCGYAGEIAQVSLAHHEFFALNEQLV